MNIKKIITAGFVAAATLAATAGEVKATVVTAQQRYPRNGLVDISVTLQGSAEDINTSGFFFAATNSATKVALPVAHITQNGVDTGSGATWTRKYIWDTYADVGEVKIDDVALAVEVLGPVQLWKDGPYWAQCNVGATKPEEYGYYFRWGDTVGYKRNAADNGWVSVKDGSSFSFSSKNCPKEGKDNSQLQAMGYIDSTGNLLAAHDAATVHLGAPWRMPTDAEFSAMIDNCDTEWTTHNGVWGRLVKGRGAYASRSVFLPAAGYGYGTLLGYLGDVGHFWSSSFSLYLDDSIYGEGSFGFSSSGINRSAIDCCNGIPVRPVQGSAPVTVAAGGVSTHFPFDGRTEVVKATSVAAKQRYPWNGLVDITVTIEGAAEYVAQADCLFVATNSATKVALSVAHVTQNGADTRSGTTWTRKFIWDANADVGEVKIDDVILAVDATIGVQLWESGPYWAKYNVGATRPEECGYYFWWGDTVGYKRNSAGNGWVSVKDGSSFSFSGKNCPTEGKDNSRLQSMGYIDSTGNLVAAHDAATAYLGALWRMPKETEIFTMTDNCDTEWTTHNGVRGKIVKGRGAYASRSIFLPAVGLGHDSGLDSLGSVGRYWSSTPHSNYSFWTSTPDSGRNCARDLGFSSDDIDYFCPNYNNRYCGQSVRPVRGFAQETVVAGGVSTHFSFDGRTEVVKVTSVTVQQQYPWNGLVDITVTIEGAAEYVAQADCLFVATNSATKAALPVVHITPNGAGTGSGTIWTRKYIWDMHADVGEVKIDDIVLAVDATIGVQLWEGGPYWAPCNVGATKPEEYGYCFWWGDALGYERNTADNGWVSVKDGSSFSFSSENCPTHEKDNSQLQSMGYIDSTGNLVAAHDAATAHLGAPWRMPTDSEFSAMINNCDTEWATINDVKGWHVKGRGTYASKSIFLPAAGYSIGSSPRYISSNGRYWSSTPNSDDSDCAWYLSLNSSYFRRGSDYRNYGQSVRPVRGFAQVTVVGGDVSTHFSFDGQTEIVKVTSVTAQQRYPRDGLVDIIVTLQGSAEDINTFGFFFAATNSATKVAMPVAHITQDGVDTGSGTTWTRKYIWDMCADVGGAKIDDVALAVEVLGPVQLWKDGPCWAQCNVGATKPEECGYYFWWGDTVGYKRNAVHNGWASVKDGSSFSFGSGNCSTYGEDNSGLQSMGYIDSTGNLVTAHDAATVHLGASWRMPTVAEFSAMCSNCDRKRTTYNGVRGWLVKGRGTYASRSIFLPDAGIGYGSRLSYLGSYGYYWSSTLYSQLSYDAWEAYDLFGFSGSIDGSSIELSHNNRYSGQSVRPVRGSAPVTVVAGGVSTHFSFDGRIEVAKVSGVTAIPAEAFKNYTELTEVVISDMVTEIGADAFAGCTKLTKVVFPSGMEVTREKLRRWGLSDAVLDDYVEGDFIIVNTSLLGYVGAADVAELVIPDGIELIDEYALSELYDLERVELPETVKYVGKGAFANDTYLDEVVLPDSAEEIGEGTFENCSWMQTMTMGAGVRSVGDRAFAGCTKLASAKFAEGLGEVGDAAFSNCWRMMSVSLPASVSNVAATAFKDCASLTGVMVPTMVAPMSEWFASVYRQIENVTVPEGTTEVCAEMFAGCAALKTVELPEGVTNIASGAFRDCVALETILLPESLEAIGDEAFAGCAALKAIVLPKNVAVLGRRVFSGCAALSDVTLSRALTAIPDGTFAGCDALDSFVVPEAVTELGSQIVPSATTAIYYLGNAPAYAADVYAQANAALVSYVVDGTKGWDGRPTSRDIPQSWPTSNARAIGTWSPTPDNPPMDPVEPVMTNTITYVNLQGAANTNVKIFTTNDLPLVLGPVEREGWRFLGWMPNGGVIPAETVTNVAFTAMWEEIVGPPAVVYGPWGEAEAVKNPDKLEPTMLTDMEVKIDGEKAEEGDVVAVFRGDTGALCGLGKVMDDSGTLTVVCYAPKGVTLDFKVWLYESGVEEPIVVKCDNASKLAAPESGAFYEGHAISCDMAVWTEAVIVNTKVSIDTGLKGYKASGLPKGLTYDTKTGKIAGTATKVTAAEGVVVKFTKTGAEPEELTLVVRKEEMSAGCEGLEAGVFPAGVVSAAAGIPLQLDTETGVKSVTVTKLPAGMKYDSKKGVITGTPTTAGDYKVVLSVTTKSGVKTSVTIPVSVEAMPLVASGTFSGFVSIGEDNFGTFTLTATSTGKLTAKAVTAKGTYSFSKTGWDSVSEDVYSATLKSSKGDVLTLTLDAALGWDKNQLWGSLVTAEIAATKKAAAVPSYSYDVTAQRRAFGKTWYFAATDDVDSGWALAYAENAKAAALTVTLKADGSTAVAGTLPGLLDAKGKALKVSASGYANVGAMKDGAILADFAPIVTINKVKKALAIRTNLWFDRSNDHESGVGEAKVVK